MVTYWLVGQPIHCITGTKLPSSQQVLAMFFYYHKLLKMMVRDSAAYVTKEVMTNKYPCLEFAAIFTNYDNIF